MEGWRKLGKALRRYVNPGTFPVAIKFLKEAEELPEEARFPGRDMQAKLAHCQAQAIARKYGWTLVLTPPGGSGLRHLRPHLRLEAG